MLEFRRRRIREDERHGRHAGVEYGIAEKVLQLRSLDVPRWGEGHRPGSDEDRTDGATPDGREEGYPSLIEMELDGVPPQHQIVHRRGAITSRRKVP